MLLGWVVGLVIEYATNNLTQHLKTTSEMVESAWAPIVHFFYHLDSDIRKITLRLERLHLKILKRKQSAVFNRTCLFIYIYIYMCVCV